MEVTVSFRDRLTCPNRRIWFEDEIVAGRALSTSSIRTAAGAKGVAPVPQAKYGCRGIAEVAFPRL